MSKTVELAQHLQKLHINNMYKNDFYWTWDKSDEEIDAEIEKFAKQIGQSVEELKKNLTEGDREYFKADVIRDKAVKFLCDNAKAE